MDKTQYIAIISACLYFASEIIGLNTRWKSNSTIQAAMSFFRVVAGMLAGKRVEVLPVEQPKQESRPE